MATAADAGGFRVGQRVHAAGDPRRVGTVRYLGPVEGHTGEYFVAAGERSASFARPTALSQGISLPDALRLRYRVEDFTKEEQG
nr:unnamed protein product [Digitaria exilis]